MRMNITLNTFDSEGNMAGTISRDLTQNQISDIIDHATQLFLVQDMADVFDSVMDELADSLVCAGIVE